MRVLTFKRLRMLAYIVAIASMVTMTLTLYKIMVFGSYTLIAPYGEAPFEITLLVIGTGVLIYVALWDLLDKKLTKKQRKVLHKKLITLSFVLLFFSFIAWNVAHFATNYSLHAYPDYVYEKNEHMDELFITKGFFWTYLHMGMVHLGIVAFMFSITYFMSNRSKVPYNTIWLCVLVSLSMLIFGLFGYNAYSDLKVLATVAHTYG